MHCSRARWQMTSTSKTSSSAQALEILHVGNGYVAINKPTGMLVHRSEALSPGEHEFAVAETSKLLVAHFGINDTVRVVHRLDRATSGVMLFALGDSYRAAELQRTLQDSKVTKKEYWTMVRRPNNVAMESEWFNDHPLKNLSKSKSTAPQPARTDFKRLFELTYNAEWITDSTHVSSTETGIIEEISFEPHSLCIVSAELRSGRRHQIRRHLSNSCFPILGDTSYGKGRHNRDARGRYDLKRLALHSHRLSFREPGTSEDSDPIVLQAPVPADLRNSLARAPGFDFALHAQLCDLGNLS